MEQQLQSNISEREISLVNNRMKSTCLFAYGKEVTILHNNEEYRLRLTGNDKLILTK